jgi:hypothetical protein
VLGVALFQSGLALLAGGLAWPPGTCDVGSGAARRRVMYWRIIQPGSAFIRRMWLRAIQKRAEGSPA